MNYMEDIQSGQYCVCIWGAGFLGKQKGFELLKKKGIVVDYYCDNNKNLWGKEIVGGIRCISPMELQEKGDKIICFLMMTNSNAKKVLIQLKSMGIEKVISFDELFIEEKQEYFPFMKRKQVVFYTCIVGDYDDLMEPLSIRSDCDYYIISDKKPEKETIFQYIDINKYLPEYIKDNTRKNRFCKINAHRIFPQYKYSIYFDGQVQIDSQIVKYTQELPKTQIVTFCKNYWKDPYMEAMRVLLNKREEEEIVLKQMEKYWLEGLPEDFGNLYCGILIRQHNNPECKKLMEDWWEQIRKFSKRDQISFSYVLWRNGYTINDINTIMENFAYQGDFGKLKERHSKPRLTFEGRIVY